MNGNEKRVLITGATGFIGSHITRELVKGGYQVVAIHRDSSSFDKCTDFYNDILWININDPHWEKLLAEQRFEILIHTAWNGVSAKDRNNWNLQLSNFIFSKKIFDIAKQCNVKKIISLGSQAEYGIFTTKASETLTPCPQEAYGAFKLLTMNYLSNLCNEEDINWIWLRIFSVFGPYDNSNWLIPSTIKKLIQGQKIELTQGEQEYDYLYISDFISGIKNVINSSNKESGIYNICSGKGITIKELLIKLAEILNIPTSLLEFGVIPYRTNQNMYMVGNCDKFSKTFGKLENREIEDALKTYVDFYKSNLE